jgi:hypothetical protein
MVSLLRNDVGGKKRYPLRSESTIPHPLAGVNGGEVILGVKPLFGGFG